MDNLEGLCKAKSYYVIVFYEDCSRFNENFYTDENPNAKKDAFDWFLSLRPGNGKVFAYLTNSRNEVLAYKTFRRNNG